jgi:hypothetical protein
MPRARPVDHYVCRYIHAKRRIQMPRARPVDHYVCRYIHANRLYKCHGLAPWILTLRKSECERQA